MPPFGAGGEFPGGGSGGGGGGGGGGITKITSIDDSVTITDPTGPTVDLSVAGSGGGVSSFNTRTGDVVFDLADAETIFTADGDILIGTGSGTGALLAIGTTGQVLTTSGGTAAWEDAEAGSSWPSIDGSGSGNLTAETTALDTVGYTIHDQGSGGVLITASGTGNVQLGNSGTGITEVTSAGGMGIVDSSSSGIGITEDGVSDITIQTSGGGASTGILITNQSTDTVGIIITDHSALELQLNADNQINVAAPLITVQPTGGGFEVLAVSGANVQLSTDTGDISITTSGAASGIALQTNAADTGGIALFDFGSGGITLGNSGTGNIIVTGVPTADPHVVGALYTTAGALMVSAG